MQLCENLNLINTHILFVKTLNRLEKNRINLKIDDLEIEKQPNRKSCSFNVVRFTFYHQFNDKNNINIKY